MIKTDINLIPKRKKAPLSVTLGIPFGIILFAIVLAAGIYFPKQALQAKEIQLEELQSELISYADVQATYFKKIQDLTILNSEKKNYEEFTTSNRETMDIYKLIERLIPADVAVSKYDFTYEHITLSGIAGTDLAIADMEEALWSSQMFSKIILGTISGDPGSRTFVFTLIYSDFQMNGGDE